VKELEDELKNLRESIDKLEEYRKELISKIKSKTIPKDKPKRVQPMVTNVIDKLM
jgi:hypothetical protein